MAKTILPFLLFCLGLNALPPGGGGTTDPPDLVKAERDALKKVVLHSFTVNPLTVKPFGTVTASWNVTVPYTGFDIGIELNGNPVAAIGSQSFTLQSQTTFSLAAVILDDPTVGRILRQWTVHLDNSECHVLALPASVLTEPLKTEFDTMFGGSSRFTLKGSGTTVTLGTDLINIDVPLSINVPDWFDADMDIPIQITAAGNTNLFVGDAVVNPTVSWSFLSNLLSLGCTGLIGDGMSQISKVFLEEIVDAQLVPAVKKELTAAINSFTVSLTAQDPAHRTFVMTSLLLTSSGITITACPQ